MVSGNIYFCDMKRFLIYFTALVLILSSCEEEEYFNTSSAFLVVNVYDYDGNLVAHYDYDENNRLVRRLFTDPVNNVSSELVFSYSNNLVSKIEFFDNDNLQSSYEKKYFYNSKNKIDKIETHQRDQLLSTFHVNYNSSGLVESFNTNDNEPSVLYEYDSHENIVKRTYYLRDPRTGEQSIQECAFEFDSFNKVSFGLDYLIGIELLPWRGTTSNWVQSLSKNNITMESCSGHEYFLEYDNNNNPTSITTTWKDIETEKPMIIRIEYMENKYYR